MSTYFFKEGRLQGGWRVLKTSEMLDAATTYQKNFSYHKKFKTVEDNACVSIIK